MSFYFLMSSPSRTSGRFRYASFMFEPLPYPALYVLWYFASYAITGPRSKIFGCMYIKLICTQPLSNTVWGVHSSVTSSSPAFHKKDNPLWEHSFH